MKTHTKTRIENTTKTRPQLNFSLVYALKALYEQRHVTRAGKAMGISQPATSNLLNLLRNKFEDELFVRQGSSMLPTPLATRLYHNAIEVNRRVENMLEDNFTFHPATDFSSFAIDLHPLLIENLGHDLVSHANQYTQMHLQLAENEQGDNLRRFNRQTCDLSVGLITQHRSAGLDYHLAFSLPYYVVMDQVHPLAQQTGFVVSVDDYLDYKHIGVSDYDLVEVQLERALSKDNWGYDLIRGIIGHSDVKTCLYPFPAL